MTASLEGKACIVTGASSGIGLAIARRLAADGARVILAARDPEKLRQAADSLEGSGHLAIPADVTSDEQAATLVHRSVEELGGIDVLINSAGFASFTPLSETTEAQWDAVIDTNLKAVFLMCRHVVPVMLQAGAGDIVNIASIAAHQGFENGAVYCASKHGLLGFSRALAMEVRRQGLRVVTISPGAVDTPLWDPMESTPDRSRMLRPEEVADATVAALTFSSSAVADEFIVMPPDGFL